MRGAAALMAALTATSCSSSGTDCPARQVHYPGGISSSGGCGPATAECRSWAVWIAPGWAGGSEPQLVFDRSVSPAQANLKAGARMQVGLVSGRLEPQGCTVNIRLDGYSFRSSDPAVLRFIETAPTYNARFQAIAPGTARVLADGPTAAELSICIDPATFDDKNCARTPLVIRVAP